MSSNRVERLSEEAIRKIAAGEVVERPASVVKELLENSIDAGSGKIVLEILEGGRKLIRISDDGCGMGEADALLALERHTTSKIRSVSDLESLSTFGFRGEALPSIASVSKADLYTRSETDAHGVHLSLDGGNLIEKKYFGRARGTTLEIKDLFFNTPARLKFMKSEGAERNKIFRTFEETAVAHPEIAFTLKSENRTVTDLPARTRPVERIRDLWGEEFNSDSLIPLSFEHPYLSIRGWVSHPQHHKPTKNFQVFYVNKRPIFSRFITHALYEAYRDSLPVGRHPSAILFIGLDAGQVDVNVHPSKREVRFRNEPQIYQALVNEIRLKRSNFSQTSPVYKPEGDSPLEPQKAGEWPAPSWQTHLPRLESPSRSAQPAASPVRESAAVLLKEETRVLCQFSALYAIAEQGRDLLIVDQHAASERVLYEKFKAALKSEGFVPSQPLLIPYLWNVTLPQAELVRNQRELLQKLGFAIEDFGDKTFRIAESPAGIQESDLAKILDELLISLDSEKEVDLIIESQIMRQACRAAVKANDRLSNPELSQILRDLSQCGNPHTCPHGRPVTLTLTREELDRKFRRT